MGDVLDVVTDAPSGDFDGDQEAAEWIQCLAVAVDAESAGAKLWLLKTSGPFPAAAAAVNRLYITLNPPAGSIKLKRTPRLGPVLAQIVMALMVKAKKNRLANYGSHVTNHIQPASHAVAGLQLALGGSPTCQTAQRPALSVTCGRLVGIVALHVRNSVLSECRTNRLEPPSLIWHEPS